MIHDDEKKSSINKKKSLQKEKKSLTKEQASSTKKKSLPKENTASLKEGKTMSFDDLSLPNDLKNWRSEGDEDGIVWLGLDVVDGDHNILNEAVLDELTQLVDCFEKNPPKAVVLYSCKKNGFIVGADIKSFSAITTVRAAHDYVVRVQELFLRWANLSSVTVAMISGLCLGGGCELALSCDWRVAEADLKTRMGLPEVQLGIIPGWGGTVRLPRLVGIRRALPLLLQGRLLRSKAALRIGLCHAAVPIAQLKAAARYYALGSTSSFSKPPRAVKVSWIDRLLAVWPYRQLVAWQAKRQLAMKVSQQHYPAPYTIVENWRRYGAKGERSFALEAKTISHLLLHPTCQHLVRIFNLRTGLKKKPEKHNLQNIKHVHVIGAGVMGGDIAAWCALQGLTVTLQDVSLERLQPAYKRALLLFHKTLKLPHLKQKARDALHADPRGDGVANADLIIEAIVENLEAKASCFSSIEERCRDDAILATNTSAIELDKINAQLKHPERLLGLHFFNPVAKMPLVEIVFGEKTATDLLERAKVFCGQINKLPLLVKSRPGFLVNRTLMPYLLEAVMMLEEGYSAQQIDAVAIDLGMPVGPVLLADQVGLDICLNVAENLLQHFPGKVPDILRQAVKSGDLGVKTGRGFYQHSQSSKKSHRSSKLKVSPQVKALQKTKKELQGHRQDLRERLLMRMLNESVACLREGIVEGADYLDAGMIFGCGFPPFTGGPLCLAAERGLSACRNGLKVLEDHYGERFAADAGWHDEELFAEILSAK